jgi:hypothetical protein
MFDFYGKIYYHVHRLNLGLSYSMLFPYHWATSIATKLNDNNCHSIKWHDIMTKINVKQQWETCYQKWSYTCSKHYYTVLPMTLNIFQGNQFNLLLRWKILYLILIMLLHFLYCYCRKESNVRCVRSLLSLHIAEYKNAVIAQNNLFCRSSKWLSREEIAPEKNLLQ